MQQSHQSVKNVAAVSHLTRHSANPGAFASLLLAFNPAHVYAHGIRLQTWQEQHPLAFSIQPSSRAHIFAKRPYFVKMSDADASGNDKILQEVPVLQRPDDSSSMIRDAVAAVNRARDAGVTRFTLRLLLPREEGEELKLVPCDESWSGGIMELFRSCSPVVRDLLRELSNDIGGVPPALTEQRLDESMVDGESLWSAQSSKPADDAMAFVQPSDERMEDIRSIASQAGSRPVLIVNPQWRERDDLFDDLSRKGGLLGMFGNMVSGKGGRDKALAELGFTDVYKIAEYICRGSFVSLVFSYPYGWTAFYKDDVTQEWVSLFSGSKERPVYQDVEQALIDAGVKFKFNQFESNNR
jgi:hypothetical protein